MYDRGNVINLQAAHHIFLLAQAVLAAISRSRYNKITDLLRNSAHGDNGARNLRATASARASDLRS